MINPVNSTCPFCRQVLIRLPKSKVFSPVAPRKHETKEYTMTCNKCGILFADSEIK